MNATDIEIDLGAIKHLDFEEAKGCEMPVDDGTCPETAFWLVAMKCCGDSAQVCTPHKDLMVDMPRRYNKAHMFLVCSGCHHRFGFRVPIDQILTVTPLT